MVAGDGIAGRRIAVEVSVERESAHGF